MRSVLQGLLAGLAYWAVEYFFTTTVDVVVKDDLVVPAWHWPMSGTLLLAYCSIGVICGLVARTLVPAASRLFSTLLLVVIFLVNGLLVTDRWYDDEFLLIAIVILAIGFFWRPEWLDSPWVASLLLIAPFWFYQEFFAEFPHPVRAIVLLALAVLAFNALLLDWRWARVRAMTPANDLVFAIIFVPLLPAISWVLRDAGAPALAEKTSAAKGPNIVLIVMDTVRADHLSLYGYARETAPNLRDFASEATLFRRAIASGDVSLPSHASLFTGLYASRHGAHNVLPEYPVGRPLEDEAVTIAEVLAKRSYRTIGVTANHAYLGPAFKLAQGFEVMDSRRPVQVRYQWSRHYLRAGVKAMLNRLGYAEEWALAYRRADEVNGAALRLVDQTAGSPFLLFVNYMDAQGHVPHARGDASAPEIIPGRRRMTASQRERVIAAYDENISRLDAGLGRLIARLRERGVYENSLIAITSDHGETFGEKDLAGHGVSVLQSLVHVPLIVKFPNVLEPARGRTGRESAVRGELASHVDFVPTVLELTGIAPMPLDGVSWMHGPEDRCVFAESYPHQSLYDFSARFRRIERAVYCGDRKLIASTAGRRELYDPWSDPAEQRDLAAREVEETREMEQRLAAWLKLARPRRPVEGTLDREALERLRALGYVQ